MQRKTDHFIITCTYMYKYNTGHQLVETFIIISIALHPMCLDHVTILNTYDHALTQVRNIFHRLGHLQNVNEQNNQDDQSPQVNANTKQPR